MSSNSVKYARNPNPIQYIGLGNIGPSERRILDTLSSEYYDKIQRSLKNITSVVIQIKVHSKNNSKKKWSINMRVIAPTRIIESDNAVDWDFARTLHKSFNQILQELEHTFRSKDQPWKRKERNLKKGFLGFLFRNRG